MPMVWAADNLQLITDKVSKMNDNDGIGDEWEIGCWGGKL